MTFWAESTGVARGQPVEFMLISHDSGHGYEALFFSHTAPGDLRVIDSFSMCPCQKRIGLSVTTDLLGEIDFLISFDDDRVSVFVGECGTSFKITDDSKPKFEKMFPTSASR